MAVRSAAVLARMKAHQKAQLVRLLSSGLQVSDDRHLKVYAVASQNIRAM